MHIQHIPKQKTDVVDVEVCCRDVNVDVDVYSPSSKERSLLVALKPESCVIQLQPNHCRWAAAAAVAVKISSLKWRTSL